MDRENLPCNSPPNYESAVFNNDSASATSSSDANTSQCSLYRPAQPDLLHLRLERQLSQEEEKVEQLTNHNKGLTNHIEDLMTENYQQSSRINNLQQQLSACTRQLADQTGQTEALEEKIKVMEQNSSRCIDDLLKQIEDLEKANKQLTEDCNQANARMRELMQSSSEEVETMKKELIAKISSLSLGSVNTKANKFPK